MLAFQSLHSSTEPVLQWCITIERITLELETVEGVYIAWVPRSIVRGMYLLTSRLRFKSNFTASVYPLEGKDFVPFWNKMRATNQ